MQNELVILHLPAYEDGTEYSETSAYKIQTPGNYPEESIQHSKQGESLKSRKTVLISQKKQHVSIAVRDRVMISGEIIAAT